MQDLSFSPRTKKKMIRSCNTNDRGTLENVDGFEGSELQHRHAFLPSHNSIEAASQMFLLPEQLVHCHCSN